MVESGTFIVYIQKDPDGSYSTFFYCARRWVLGQFLASASAVGIASIRTQQRISLLLNIAVLEGYPSQS